MHIYLKLNEDEQPLALDVQQGMTHEMLARRYSAQLPFPVLAAKQNNMVVRLTEPLLEGSEIEFVDMRNRTAELIYQNSATLIYIKAAHDVLGAVPIIIQHSLNKGIFTEVKTPKPITEAQVTAIRDRMEELVRMDLPLDKHIVSREEALKSLVEGGMTEKIRILNASPQLERVKYYALDGFKDFFYGTMVPSTGYIKKFELKKYRDGVLLRFPQPTKPNKMPAYRNEKQMYNAFAEATKWQNLLGISYVCDLNEKIASGDIKEVIQLSEALHEKSIVQIALRIVREGKRIILIAGPSSSGKTTFARRLRIQLQVEGLHPLTLGTDDYFMERSQTPLDGGGQPNFEDLDALDVKLFNQDMNDLLSGRETDLPTFDFISGTKRFGLRKTILDHNDPIIIEGIHALNPEMTPDIPDKEKFCIYISPLTQLNLDDHNRIPTTDTRMLRRMVRDHQYRGKTAVGTIREWPKVRAGEEKNIFPYNSEADVFFNSVHIYELAVLKKYAEPLLWSVTPEEPEYSEAARMLRFLDFFNKVDDDSVISNNSIIREFIGGSIFVED